MTLAIFANVTIALTLIALNAFLSIKQLRTITSQVNQKGAGKLVTNITYVFLIKFALLLLAVFVSGASPVTLIALIGLNVLEYKFTNPKLKK